MAPSQISALFKPRPNLNIAVAKTKKYESRYTPMTTVREQCYVSIETWSIDHTTASLGSIKAVWSRKTRRGEARRGEVELTPHGPRQDPPALNGSIFLCCLQLVGTVCHTHFSWYGMVWYGGPPPGGSPRDKKRRRIDLAGESRRPARGDSGERGCGATAAEKEEGGGGGVSRTNGKSCKRTDEDGQNRYGSQADDDTDDNTGSRYALAGRHICHGVQVARTQRGLDGKGRPKEKQQQQQCKKKKIIR